MGLRTRVVWVLKWNRFPINFFFWVFHWDWNASRPKALAPFNFIVSSIFVCILFCSLPQFGGQLPWNHFRFKWFRFRNDSFLMLNDERFQMILNDFVNRNGTLQLVCHVIERLKIYDIEAFDCKERCLLEFKHHKSFQMFFFHSLFLLLIGVNTRISQRKKMFKSCRPENDFTIRLNLAGKKNYVENPIALRKNNGKYLVE